MKKNCSCASVPTLNLRNWSSFSQKFKPHFWLNELSLHSPFTMEMVVTMEIHTKSTVTPIIRKNFTVVINSQQEAQIYNRNYYSVTFQRVIRNDLQSFSLLRPVSLINLFQLTSVCPSEKVTFLKALNSGRQPEAMRSGLASTSCDIELTICRKHASLRLELRQSFNALLLCKIQTSHFDKSTLQLEWWQRRVA